MVSDNGIIMLRIRCEVVDTKKRIVGALITLKRHIYNIYIAKTLLCKNVGTITVVYNTNHD